MSKEEQVKQLTDYMAKFIAYTAKKLPDDVIAKLQELRDKEDSPSYPQPQQFTSVIILFNFNIILSLCQAQHVAAAASLICLSKTFHLRLGNFHLC